MMLEPWADNQQARIQDPIAATGWGELQSHALAPADLAVRKRVTASR